MLPTFLVLGAARSGTTSLHYYLAQHPDICMSATKEPNFFVFEQTPSGPRPCIADDRRLLAKSVADRERYERLFACTGQSAVGEASPLYLYTRESPRLIATLVPDARLIAVVREPVDRAWSHFVYVNGDLGEDTLPAFVTAVDRELPLGYEPYRTGTHFLRLSRYAEQLDRYRDVFGPDQLLVLSYDELVTTPATALARVCHFLGVDASYEFDTDVQYNPSTGHRPLVERIDRLLRPAIPYVKRALPAGIAGRLAESRARVRAGGRALGRPPLPRDLATRLDDYFADDIGCLARDYAITFPGSPPAA